MKRFRRETVFLFTRLAKNFMSLARFSRIVLKIYFSMVLVRFVISFRLVNVIFGFSI